MFKKFFPKQEKFYELLTELATSILEGATLLNQMLINHDHIAEDASRIHILENKCDELRGNYDRVSTINDQLKNICQIEHSRHRSVYNFIVNVISGLIGYSFLPKKPSLNIDRGLVLAIT